ncbi:MAG TPA: DUF3201 domain-containing protein, partial [Anaerolineaceae bacterium]|nr:DUF3201 domain-containing protein [Anaerolineaceae bacterium]
MEERIQDLNRVYQPVYEQMKSILKELKAQGYPCEWGFYNQHSIKQAGTWVLEYYPIPVITVKDVCEIGLDMDHTFIECKLKREMALAFDFSFFNKYKYEVYGIEDFLNDFYNETLDFD